MRTRRVPRHGIRLRGRRGVDYRIVAMTTTPRADPVGIVEIAERLDVVRDTVDKWRERGLLPDADYTVGGRPAWEWSTIEAWAVETGRLEPPKRPRKR